jgi:hypothetical protein
MTPQGLFVALVRAGGLLFAIQGLVVVAAAAISLGFAPGSHSPIEPWLLGPGVALILIGVGLVVLAPMVARLLGWPGSSDAVRSEEPFAVEATAAPAWRVAARAVACLALLWAVEPASRLLADVLEGRNLAKGSPLSDVGVLAAYAAAVFVLARVGREPSRAAR